MPSNSSPKKIVNRQPGKSVTVRGTAVAVFSGGMALIDTSGGKSAPVKHVKRDEQTNSLIKKVGEALERPGVARKTVFPPGGNTSFVYAVDPNDPSILVRRSPQGKRERGRLIHGRFQPLPAK